MARNLDLNNLVVTTLDTTTLSIGSTAITATAAELNVCAGVTPGTAAASKALVLNGSKGISTIASASIDNLSALDIDSSSGLDLGLATATAMAIGRTGIGINILGDVKTGVGVGAIVANKCTVVEGGDGVFHKTTFTFTLTGANDLDLADGADHGTGIKIYDFPAGDILILGATVNAAVTSTNAEGGGATFPMALGSTVGQDDATLTGTEADIIPSTVIDGGTGEDWFASLAASILLQNAGGSDLDLYVNVAITNAVSQGAVTIAVTGNAVITWVNLGDY